MNKTALRVEALKKMRSISSGDRKELSVLIAGRFFVHFPVGDIRVVHLFLSIEANNEVDTAPFVAEFMSSEQQPILTVPRVNGKDLETLRFDSRTVLKPSAWKVPEPIDDRFVDPEEIDLVIVPLLAFDLRGHRVGYGKGFYDRFLKRCRTDCKKVGVSFFPHVENIDDADENDVRLDYCLTPFNSYKF